ncbi:MAG: hypothetical protein ACJ8JD_02505 [Chthoniobacterales bacterium]
MGFLVRPWAFAHNRFTGTSPAQIRRMMQATFIQKVLICAFLAFLAAGIIEWGKVFVTGADEALNGGYKNTAPADLAPRRR